MTPARLAGLACVMTMAGPPTSARADDLAKDRPAGQFETVATFDGAMPTRVTVSRTGSIFVSFPKWGKVDFTVAEVKQGKAVAYPDAPVNAEHLISVQSVVVAPSGRLWIVDTGSIEFGPTSPGGRKLVGVDLATDMVFKTITFPTDVALTTS